MSENDMAKYLFHQGTNFSSYTYMGCNSKKSGSSYIYTFRTWAPNAVGVFLISDYFGWDNPIPFAKITDGGIWELVITTETSLENTAYKFKIQSKSGFVNKGDPYARFSKGGADGASIVYTVSEHKWSDGNWLKHRKAVIRGNEDAYLSAPVNIYELHIASFIKRSENEFVGYRELADNLSVYCKAMGYTHVELLPVMEHPYLGSWGYQICGYYAPTSRLGSPDDFKYFINKMHKSGIGVILDWVPAHFPKDEWGLYEFDGAPLYEYQGKDRQESLTWGTRYFDVGREEVQSFLISNALYYLREFHIDGLRVDAVASMLYLDYDKAPGEWVPNIDGTNINPEAEAFFKKLNTAIFSEFQDCLMIAEESTSIGNITKPVHDGGYGFNMKWNMGWANDFYKYLSMSPHEKAMNHKALNFPIMYAFQENYCLPISHDEVVHGKLSFIGKMFGEYDDKFELMRCAVLLMMTYPGKKLTFMGTEFAQFREWDFENSLEWFMLDYPKHYEMREYVKALNHFYLSHSELYDRDFIPTGFSWILPDESEKCTVAYRRINNQGKTLIVVINFSERDESIRLPVIKSKTVDVLFSTRPHLTENSFKTSLSLDRYYIDIIIPRLTGYVLVEKNGKKTIKI